MFNLYPKNVPNIERIIRIVFGVFLIIMAFVGQPLFGLPSALWIGVLLFNALFVIITGFYGWCPACALIGRKIKSQQPIEN
jgi:hypothetical protein